MGAGGGWGLISNAKILATGNGDRKYLNHRLWLSKLSTRFTASPLAYLIPTTSEKRGGAQSSFPLSGSRFSWCSSSSIRLSTFTATRSRLSCSKVNMGMKVYTDGNVSAGPCAVTTSGTVPPGSDSGDVRGPRRTMGTASASSGSDPPLDVKQFLHPKPTAHVCPHDWLESSSSALYTVGSSQWPISDEDSPSSAS